MKKLALLAILPFIGTLLALRCGGKDEDKPGRPQTDTGGSGGVTSGGSSAGGTATGGTTSLGGAGGSSGANTGGAGGGTGKPPVEDGKTCTTNDDCGGGQLCHVGASSSQGTCRTECSTSNTGQQGPCESGKLCALTSTGTTAGCLEACSPYANPPGCGASEWCLGSPGTRYVGGATVDGLCVPTDPSAPTLGGACDTQACGSGLECYTPAAPTLGKKFCGTACKVGAAAGAPGACPSGQECRAQLTGGAACVTTCDPYAPTAGCDAGLSCVAFLEAKAGLSVIEGHCAKPGTLGEGEVCDPGECGAGLICGKVNVGAGEEPARCRPICSTTGAGECGTGACAQMAGMPAGLGQCLPDCIAFSSGTAAGCDNGEWCAPTSTAGASACIASGTSQLGGSCTNTTDCVAGGTCDCRFGSDALCMAGGQCEQACDPKATTGGPGACPTGRVCVPEVKDGATLPYGACRELCVVGGTDGCTVATETCVPGPFLGASADACMDMPTPAAAYGSFCGAPKYDFREPCAPRGLCLLIANEPKCFNLCRVSKGALGTKNHPDCAAATLTCTQIEAGLPYGRCQ